MIKKKNSLLTKQKEGFFQVCHSLGQRNDGETSLRDLEEIRCQRFWSWQPVRRGANAGLWSESTLFSNPVAHTLSAFMLRETLCQVRVTGVAHWPCLEHCECIFSKQWTLSIRSMSSHCLLVDPFQTQVHAHRTSWCHHPDLSAHWAWAQACT